MYRVGDRVRILSHVSEHTATADEMDVVWTVEKVREPHFRTSSREQVIYLARPQDETFNHGPFNEFDLERVHNGIRIFMEML